ncbi:hypothetical protein BDW74DRAFT_29796 [Aspergillus multicolor]|uniref:uncharacterized protein n=1 Tax=Aspergillus multicolor TaxID=41759 RepID=UPI003CCCA773
MAVSGKERFVLMLSWTVIDLPGFVPSRRLGGHESFRSSRSWPPSALIRSRLLVLSYASALCFVSSLFHALQCILFLVLFSDSLGLFLCPFPSSASCFWPFPPYSLKAVIVWRLVISLVDPTIRGNRAMSAPAPTNCAFLGISLDDVPKLVVRELPNDDDNLGHPFVP